jgi:hypothetical protein
LHAIEGAIARLHKIDPVDKLEAELRVARDRLMRLLGDTTTA